MIDLNEEAKRSLETRIQYLFLPQQYSAESIRDFLENKSYIKPTKKVLPIGSFWNGLSIIAFERSADYMKLCYPRGVLSDGSGKIEVIVSDELRTRGLTTAQLSFLGDRAVLNQPRITYSPETGAVWLTSYDLVKKRIEQEIKTGSLSLSFA